ncbi:MAG: diguanylate cyclase [Bacillota bacterium]
MNKRVILLLILLMVLGSSQLSYCTSEPTIKDGILNLNKNNYQQQLIELSGEWETYSQQLYSPQEITEHSPDSLSTPGLWKKYSVFGHELPFLREMEFGYATYHLVIKNNNIPLEAIKIGEIANSYKVWVNDELVAVNGQVGKSKNLEVPQMKENIIELPETNNINIVIQISNFHFKEKRFSNYNEKIMLGTKEQLQQADFITPVAFAVGIIMFSVLFSFYLFRGKSKHSFYLSLFSLLLSFKLLINHNLFNIDLITQLSDWYLQKINLLILVGAIVLFISYLKKLYQTIISDMMFKIILGSSFIFAMLIIASSINVYNSTFIYGQFAAFFLVLYLVYTAIKGLFEENYNYFISMLFLIATITIYNSNLFFNKLFLNSTYLLLLILLIVYQVIYLIKNNFKSLIEYKQEKKNKIEMENLAEVTSLLHSSLDKQQIARLAKRKLTKLITYDSIVVMGKEGNNLKELAIRGERNIEDSEIKISENELFNDLINRTSPMIVDEVEDVPWFDKYGKLKGIKSWLGVPLIAEGEIVGVLTLGNKKVKEYSEISKSRLNKFSKELALSLQNSYKYSEIKELAAKDSLTGLYNRKAFKEIAIKEYNQAARYEHQFSLLLIDIDQYKDIINELDYGVGDEIVKVIAERCEDSIRTADYMGRYEGVRLGIVLTDTGLFGAQELASRLRRIINEAIVVEGHGDILVSASYGISTLEEKVGITTLFELAESALAKAQKDGGDCIKTMKD